MYLRGMAGLGLTDEGYEDEGEFSQTVYYPVTNTTTPTPVVASDSAGWNVDWGGMVSSAMKTWGQVKTAEIQAEPQLIYAQRGVNPLYYQTPGGYNPYMTGSYPFQPGMNLGPSGTLFGLPMTWVLLGGAGIIAAVMLTSGGKK